MTGGITVTAKTPSDLDRLREMVASDPNRGDTRYLLGTQLASAGQYEDAVLEIRRAIELDPSLHTARFQLGLLHLTSARPADAIEAWRALGSLAEGDPLRLFKQGLEALIRDDFPTCINLLEQGIRANTANPALNRDMALVIDRTRLAMSAPPPAAPAPTEAAEARTDFSLYDSATKH